MNKKQAIEARNLLQTIFPTLDFELILIEMRLKSDFVSWMNAWNIKYIKTFAVELTSFDDWFSEKTINQFDAIFSSLGIPKKNDS